jgi:hypothetical protein
MEYSIEFIRTVTNDENYIGMYDYIAYYVYNMDIYYVEPPMLYDDEVDTFGYYGPAICSLKTKPKTTEHFGFGYYEDAKGELHEKSGYNIPVNHVCPDGCAF